MHKKLLVTSIFIILAIYFVTGQKRAATLSKEFKNLIGCWQGTLNYSGTIIRKPYSTNAEVIVKRVGKSHRKFEFLHIYTKDPKDNAADTITISEDGRKLNNAMIKSKRYTPEEDLEVITEALGFDHDNDKAAIVKQTYTLGKGSYSYKKQVQLEGQADWLDRLEFKYTSRPCKSNR